MTDIYSLAGWIGALLIISAFFLLNFQYVTMGITYELLNIFGSIGLGLSAFHTGNFAMLLLQVFWAGIALVMILRGFTNHPTHRYHRHEEKLSHD